MSRRELGAKEVQELEASVKGDLRALQNADLVHADEAVLRDVSAKLRRLLTDDATLQRLRRAMGLKGEARVKSTSWPVGPGAVYTQSAGAQRAGGTVSGFVFYDRALTPNEIQEHFQKATSATASEVTISKWLTSRCMTLDGVGVTRRDVIQFVANKLGGVHFDTSRNPKKSPAHAVLDGARQHLRLGDQDSVYAELTAIAQQLLDSPDVQALFQSEPPK